MKKVLLITICIFESKSRIAKWSISLHTSQHKMQLTWHSKLKTDFNGTYNAIGNLDRPTWAGCVNCVSLVLSMCFLKKLWKLQTTRNSLLRIKLSGVIVQCYNISQEYPCFPDIRWVTDYWIWNNYGYALNTSFITMIDDSTKQLNFTTSKYDSKCNNTLSIGKKCKRFPTTP